MKFRPVQVFEVDSLTYGYERVFASGTSIRFDAISDADGSVFDTFELTKPAGWGAAYHASNGRPRKMVCLLSLHPWQRAVRLRRRFALHLQFVCASRRSIARNSLLPRCPYARAAAAAA
jgi:hypothetical protein